MTLVRHSLVVLAALVCLVAIPAIAATPESEPATSLPLDEFALQSPYSSMAMANCRSCIYQIGECADQSTNGDPCGPALTDPNSPCRCGNCNQQFTCKRPL